MVVSRGRQKRTFNVNGNSRCLESGIARNFSTEGEVPMATMGCWECECEIERSDGGAAAKE